MDSGAGVCWLRGGGNGALTGSGVRWTSKDMRVDDSVGGGVLSGSHSGGALGGVFPVFEGEVETVG